MLTCFLFPSSSFSSHSPDLSPIFFSLIFPFFSFLSFFLSFLLSFLPSLSNSLFHLMILFVLQHCLKQSCILLNTNADLLTKQLPPLSRYTKYFLVVLHFIKKSIGDITSYDIILPRPDDGSLELKRYSVDFFDINFFILHYFVFHIFSECVVYMSSSVCLCFSVSLSLSLSQFLSIYLYINTRIIK